MKPVSTIRGCALPLYLADIDTDQILPKQFLTRLERTGYGEFVFYEWRRDPGFVFNDTRFAAANILVAGENFGSGSSREHAVWALQQYGIQAVLAPSFSDIFAGNSVQNGLLIGEIPGEIAQQLATAAWSVPAPVLEVDLGTQTVRWPGGSVRFAISPADRESLLNGSDDIGLILDEIDEIEAYERRRPRWSSTTIFAVGGRIRESAQHRRTRPPAEAPHGPPEH